MGMTHLKNMFLYLQANIKALATTNESLLLAPLLSCSWFSNVSNAKNVKASLNGLHISSSITASLIIRTAVI